MVFEDVIKYLLMSSVDKGMKREKEYTLVIVVGKIIP